MSGSTIIGVYITAPTAGDTNYCLELSADTARKPSTNTWTISSDSRIKKDIVSMNTAEQLAIINQIQIKKYRFNEHYRIACNLEDREFIGVVADEVESIHPNAVQITPQMKVNYSRVIDGKDNIEDDEYTVVVPDENDETKEKVEWTIPSCKTYQGCEINMMLIGAIQELKKEIELLKARD